MAKKNKSPQKDDNTNIVNFTLDDWINEKHLTYNIPNTPALCEIANYNDNQFFVNLSENKEEPNLEPLRLIMINFSPEERKKIEEKQKEIFLQLVENAFEEYKDRFLKNHKSALIPEKFLEHEISIINNILTNEKFVFHFKIKNNFQIYSPTPFLIDATVNSTTKNKDYINPIVEIYQCIVQNILSYESIEPHYINDFNQRNDLIIAFTFFKYLSFLKEKLEGKSTVVSNIKKLNKSQSPRKKKDLTFLELFKHNEERIEKFFSLLRSPFLDAIDKENNWNYNTRKSSIVACFKALKELGYIKNIPKAELQRIVKTKIEFGGDNRLFRGETNPDDYNDFLKKFEKHLK